MLELPHPPPARIARIHPPINKHHPPVVSAVSEWTETAWMTLPPPSAAAAAALNRHINGQRGRAMSVESAETGLRSPAWLPLDVENMVVVAGGGGAAAGKNRRKKFAEGVLEDMEAPKPVARKDTEEMARQVVKGRTLGR